MLFAKSLKKWPIVIALLFFSGMALAVNSPIIVLQNTANQMLAFLQRHKSELKRKPQLINQIVNQALVPHIDTERMAGLVVGRNYWASASAAKRQAFIREFVKLVVSTYANALAAYNGDKVHFYPIRGGYTKQKTVVVKSDIVRRNGQRIAISYNLILRGTKWKVYDFSIEEVSMVQNYRSQFSGVLAQNGLPGLLQRLTTYNRERH